MIKIRREQIAGMNMHYKYRTLDYFFKTQQALGIKNIEFWCARPHFLLDDYGFEDAAELKKNAADYGLTIGAFSPECAIYNYALCCHDETARKHSIGYFENGIRAAAEAGAKVMVLNCCGGARNEDPRRIFERAVQTLRRLSKTAAEEGVVLAVETVRPEDATVINMLPELKKLLESVNEPQIQAALNLTSAGVAGESMKDWFEALGDKIYHIRFVDGRPQGCLAWGDGLRPLEDQLICLDQYKYKGLLSLALNDARYLEDPAAADRQNMRELEPFIMD